MSVLEAMALGCVPVVHDEPALNEYVDPAVGYLWRIEHPAALDLGALDAKRERLPAHLQRLRSRWQTSAFDISSLLEENRCVD